MILGWLGFNRRNRGKWHLFRLILFLGSLIVIVLVQTYQINLPTQTQYFKERSDVFSPIIAKSITVKVLSGKFGASGTIISRKKNIYTVLTNAHVLNSSPSNYQIQTPDGKIYQAMRKASNSWFQGKDLAILEFVSHQNEYAIAKLGKTPKPRDKVLAAGFPFSFMTPKNEDIVLRTGIVWRMLEKPLKGGYQLGYTNNIEKGMSGSPLLNSQGEVVAINGMHAYPLFGNPYIYEDGTIPESSLLEQMSDYSWGIPVERFKKLILN